MCKAALPDERNTFSACFEILNKESDVKSTMPPENLPLSLSKADARGILLGVNVNEKATGPDNIPGLVLTCPNQLVDVITDIFLIYHCHRGLFQPV